MYRYKYRTLVMSNMMDGFSKYTKNAPTKTPKITVWSVFKHHWELISEVFARIPTDSLSHLVLNQFQVITAELGIWLLASTDHVSQEETKAVVFNLTMKRELHHNATGFETMHEIFLFH